MAEDAGGRRTMRRMALAGAAFVLLLALALGGCGEDEEPGARQTTTTGPPEIELTVVHDDGSGRRTTGTLTCRGADRRATGALASRASAAELCAHARAIRGLLTTQPDRDRVCSQIYGGPETAHVTGTIGTEKVDRRFSRTNGCEIADFSRAAGLLRP